MTTNMVAQSDEPHALTITYESTAFRLGRPPVRFSSTVALRSDGSQVWPRVQAAPDGQFYEQQLVTDAARGKRILVESITQSITTYVLSDSHVSALRTAGSRCEGGSGVEDGSIVGYRVLRLPESVPPRPANGTIAPARLTSWNAPELGCVALRERITVADDQGGVQTVFEKEAKNIRLGEPDAALFQVPDWPERAPSQVTALIHQKFGIPVKPEEAEGDRLADAAYWAQQAARR